MSWSYTAPVGLADSRPGAGIAARPVPAPSAVVDSAVHNVYGRAASPMFASLSHTLVLAALAAPQRTSSISGPRPFSMSRTALTTAFPSPTGAAPPVPALAVDPPGLAAPSPVLASALGESPPGWAASAT